MMESKALALEGWSPKL